MKLPLSIAGYQILQMWRQASADGAQEVARALPPGGGGDRSLSHRLADTLRAAIMDGRLAAGVRLPSWRDLSAHLGIARGTVRAAYDRLSDEGLVIAAGAMGTRVTGAVDRAGAAPPAASPAPPTGPSTTGHAALPFQVDVPAADAFPRKAWSLALTRAGRTDAGLSVSEACPCGRPELRAGIAGLLAVLRNTPCSPEQVFITSGFAGGLGVVLRALGLPDASGIWTGEPGHPVARAGLSAAGLHPIPCRIDDGGLDVETALRRAPDARAALVATSQQAPTGGALTAERRRLILDWSRRTGAWILEDDSLSDLQLYGRAASPLFADASAGARVVLIGSFSHTLKPGLGLGYIVAPPELAPALDAVCTTLAPAPGDAAQLALTEFIATGQYVRHLRRMKALYLARWKALRVLDPALFAPARLSGPQTTLYLPYTADDVELASRALALGIAPAPLSPWFATPEARRPGLILSVANLGPDQLPAAWEALTGLLPDGW